ncbi:MAG: ABC transporter permease [Phycisphaerales bacterium]|nr:ABC transporter permease [Phycisphaerales bacterium]
MRHDESPLTLVGMTWRNLYRQPVRTSLTALGVAIGIIAIIALGAIARGLKASIDNGLHAGGADLTVYQAGIAIDMFSVLDEAETRTRLLSHPEIEAVAAGLSDIVPIESNPFTILIGVHPHEFGFNVQQVVEGKPFSAKDEIVIGRRARENLDKTIADELVFRGRVFKITGIFETGNVFFDGAIAMNIETLQELKGSVGKVSCFQIRLKANVDPYEAADKIEKANSHLAAVVDAEQYKKIDSSLVVADSAIWAVSFLALVIGCLIVANTMWMSVHQRTREIGVLRAIGWRRRGIMATVVLESTGIGLIACVPGCLLGVGLAKLTTLMPVTNQYLLPVFEAKPFVIAIVVAVALSIGGAVFPAFRAANISPVEALRYE